MGRLSKRKIVDELSEHLTFQTDQNVKIEYINGYEEESNEFDEAPSLGVVVEKVESDRKPNISNLNNVNVNGVHGITSLIEKFESKMMQNISTTYTEVLNEVSKSMNRIQVLAKDNAEYQEDCLKTNVSEISRYLKIFPKRTLPIQMNEGNIVENNDDDEAISDGEEEAEQQPSDMFFSVLENDQQVNIVQSKKIKVEPYSDDLIIPEEPKMEEYPIFQDVNDDSLAVVDDFGQKLGSAEQDWKCRICENNFPSRFNLRRHQRRNLKCSAAIKEAKLKGEETQEDKKLSRLPLKLFPTKSHHKFNPEVPYKPCFFCIHQFQRITELIGHLQAAHADEDMDHLADMLPSLSKDELKPDIIRQRLNDETYVKDENQYEFNGGLSRCSFCPNEFASFSRLLSHVRYVHPDCDKTQGHWTLKIFFAVEEKFPSQRVPCDVCGSEIKVENLHKHKSNHNQTTKTCPDCGKSFQSKTWQMHIKTHSKQEWLCNECGKSFKTQKSYRRHVPTHDPRFKGFECTACKKIFDRKSSLQTHNSLVHDESKKFMCQHCSYVAGISGNLTLHIRRVHTKEKPSQCPQCDYSTIGVQELGRHIIAVHERDKHFRCDTCDWSTPRKHLMDMHTRLNCKKPPFTEEDRAKSKAILAAEGGPSRHIYSY